MKNEDLRFSIIIESHNDLGEKQRSPIMSIGNRFSVIQIAESLGINLSYTAPYTMKKERQFLIEKPFRDAIREKHYVIIGEYIHEPLLCIKRLS